MCDMLGVYFSVLDTDEEKCRFEQLYIKFRREMFAVAYGILGNREDAEDAVHQAFLNIANHFEKVNRIPSQEIRAYIVIIIRNAAINIYNGNKRRAQRSAELEESTVYVDEDILERFSYEELVREISMLPQIYKDMMFLRYLEEFSPKEIASQLGISVDAVYKRDERAKKLLLEALERGDCNE